MPGEGEWAEPVRFSHSTSLVRTRVVMVVGRADKVQGLNAAWFFFSFPWDEFFAVTLLACELLASVTSGSLPG